MPALAMNTNTPVYNRVPKATVDFWLIKLMAVTMGETAADYLASSMGFGLFGTAAIMSAVLAVAHYFQFAQKKYIPSFYWAAVVLISVVGTLVTDCLIDLGAPLITTTVVFTGLLVATFAAWYVAEKTLSIHTIFTTKREAFY